MPILSELRVNNFRNLTSVTIEPSPQFNILYGDNGAGKTSLLESIYYLGFGRSFRTRHTQHIIQHDMDSFSIFTYLINKGNKVPAGIERSQNGERKIKIEGESVSTLSLLAKHLPLQLMSTISYRFFFNGPKIRRQYLDWMLFHVEPSFYSKWQSFQRILKQRNAGLKAGLPRQQLRSWDTVVTHCKSCFTVCIQDRAPAKATSSKHSRARGRVWATRINKAIRANFSITAGAIAFIF